MIFSTLLKNSGATDSWGDYLPNNPLHTLKAQDATQTPLIRSCWLNQFSALKVSGPDAERFLQGQLTCNINDLNPEVVLYGACCNAKGRTVANFNISFDGENYWLVLPTESALVLEKHLQKYKVFFKATLDNCEQSHLIFGQWVDGEAGKVSRENDKQYLQISEQRRLIICENEEKNNDSESSNSELSNSELSNSELSNLVPTLNWRLADMDDGLYYITEEQTEVWIPQHLNLHQTGGISFNKGCYTGQEIIARLQYLGKAKKALYHYRTTNDEAALKQHIDSQSLFNADGKNLGQIIFSRRHMPSEQNTENLQLDVLAVLNTDSPDEILYLTESKEIPLTLQNLSYTQEDTVKTV